MSSEPKRPGDSLEVLVIPAESHETVEEETESQETENTVSEQYACRSDRARNPPDRFGDWVSYTAACEHFAYNVCQVPEPKTIDEAMSGPHAKEWREAAESEYQSLMENDTWDLMELPEGREVTCIGSKWVFKGKHDSASKVVRFKGRLMAKGYSQKYGVDFEETFAPVVRFLSI